MNEQLKKLIEKAGGTVKITGGVHIYIDKSNLDVEKFAELVVRECAMIGDYAENGGVLKPSVMIKEYFGVEE